MEYINDDAKLMYETFRTWVMLCVSLFLIKFGLSCILSLIRGTSISLATMHKLDALAAMKHQVATLCHVSIAWRKWMGCASGICLISAQTIYNWCYILIPSSFFHIYLLFRFIHLKIRKKKVIIITLNHIVMWFIKYLDGSENYEWFIK